MLSVLGGSFFLSLDDTCVLAFALFCVNFLVCRWIFCSWLESPGIWRLHGNLYWHTHTLAHTLTHSVKLAQFE